MRIVLPDRLVDGTVKQVARDLLDALGSERVSLCFRYITFAEPSATMSVALALRSFRQRRRQAGLDTMVEQDGLELGHRSNGVSYLAHVGFFRFLGLPYGNEPGGAPGGATYVPITVLDDAVLDGQRASPTDLLETVRSRAYALAATASSDESARDLLGYCFVETIRNVFEHAGVSECAVMAQRYPSRKEVEIVVADEGRGVHSSLVESFPELDEQRALLRCIEPGVTRNLIERGLGKWENTGFGLFVLSELGRRAGVFSISSSGWALSVSPDGVSIEEQPLPGTVVRIRVDLTDAEFFTNWLHNIVSTGERQQAPDTPRKRGASKGLNAGWL